MTVAERVDVWRGTLQRSVAGVLLCTVIAIASVFISEQRGGPTLLYALLIGMALNPIVAEGRAKPGVDFAARRCCGSAWRCSARASRSSRSARSGGARCLLVVGAVAATLAFGMGAARLFGSAPLRHPHRRRDGDLRRVRGDRDRRGAAARRAVRARARSSPWPASPHCRPTA